VVIIKKLKKDANNIKGDGKKPPRLMLSVGLTLRAKEVLECIS